MLLRYFSSHGLGLLLSHIVRRFPHSDIYDSKRSLAPHRSLSQPNTSFFLFFTQGIRSLLLKRFIAISNKRNILYYCVKYLQLYLAVHPVMLMCRFNVAEVFIQKWTLIARDFSTFFWFFLLRSYIENLIKNGITKKPSSFLFDNFWKISTHLLSKIFYEKFFTYIGINFLVFINQYIW